MYNVKPLLKPTVRIVKSISQNYFLNEIWKKKANIFLNKEKMGLKM